MDGGAWWTAVHGVAKSQTRLSDFTFTFHFHALEKDMATHSSVLAWRIPGTGEPGGLPSMGSHRVGHNWSDLAATAAPSIHTPPVASLVAPSLQSTPLCSLDPRYLWLWAYFLLENKMLRTFLVIQWLRLCAFNARGMGSIPGPTCLVVQPKKKEKEKKVLKSSNWISFCFGPVFSTSSYIHLCTPIHSCIWYCSHHTPDVQYLLIDLMKTRVPG